MSRRHRYTHRYGSDICELILMTLRLFSVLKFNVFFTHEINVLIKRDMVYVHYIRETNKDLSITCSCPFNIDWIFFILPKYTECLGDSIILLRILCKWRHLTKIERVKYIVMNKLHFLLIFKYHLTFTQFVFI